MSHFYAMIPTSARRTVPTARGHKSTGVATVAAGWRGAIRCDVWHDDANDCDRYEVALTPWEGSGGSPRTLASGELNAAAPGPEPRAINSPTNGDARDALRTVWDTLQNYRDELIPEGRDEMYDDQWDDICTAMAWIHEALDINHEDI